jgi:fido (protein-threonine AMPylation protein)
MTYDKVTVAAECDQVGWGQLVAAGMHRVDVVDLIAIRFHHRLVSIHPFPNGNGRHARLMADLLVERLDQPRFTWGSRSLVDAGETRQVYIAALQAADAREYAPLLAFARS